MGELMASKKFSCFVFNRCVDRDAKETRRPTANHNFSRSKGGVGAEVIGGEDDGSRAGERSGARWRGGQIDHLLAAATAGASLLFFFPFIFSLPPPLPTSLPFLLLLAGD